MHTMLRQKTYINEMIEGLTTRIFKLKLRVNLDEISPLDQKILDEAVYLSGQDKLALLQHYKSKGNDTCELLAAEIALAHIISKNQLRLDDGNPANSYRALAINKISRSIPFLQSFLDPSQNHYCQKGIDKQCARLREIDECISDLENKYFLFKKILAS